MMFTCCPSCGAGVQKYESNTKETLENWKFKCGYELVNEVPDGNGLVGYAEYCNKHTNMSAMVAIRERFPNRPDLVPDFLFEHLSTCTCETCRAWGA